MMQPRALPFARPILSPGDAFGVTWTDALGDDDARAYDQFVDEARSGSYAQSRPWAAVARAGRQVTPRFFIARREGRILGAALVLRAHVLGVPAPVAIVERGPVTQSIDDLPDVLRALRGAAALSGIAHLRVMPYWSGRDAARAERRIRDAGFRADHSFRSAHARTLRVNLRTADVEAIFAGREHKSMRAELRRARRAGTSARRGDAADLDVLARLHGALMRAQRRPSKPPAFFAALARLVDRERAAVFVGEHEGGIVSAVLVARHGALATYIAGASSPERRGFSKTAPAMVAAVEWAHRAGCAFFDLGGIPMEGDPDAKRRAIAHFKLDFAKTPIALVREHTRWF